MYKRLRKLRNVLGISAREMADLLNLKTENAYYKKENGGIKFSLEEGKIISDKIGLPIENIFYAHETSEMETEAVVNTVNKRQQGGCSMNGQEYPIILTVEQACRLLQTTKPTMYEIIRAKQVPAFKYGRIIRLNRDELLKVVAQGGLSDVDYK